MDIEAKHMGNGTIQENLDNMHVQRENHLELYTTRGFPLRGGCASHRKWLVPIEKMGELCFKSGDIP
jgi:hypothetical protein